MKTIKLIGIFAASLYVSACVSPIQNMSSREAVQYGYDQFFEMPSYRVDTQTKIEKAQFLDGTTLEELPKRTTTNKYLNFFTRKFVFDDTLIIDKANDQYQVISQYAYQANNVNASIRFPTVYDRKNKLIYADLSAFSGLTVNIDNDGKYSRFDLSQMIDQLPLKKDAEVQAIKIARKYGKLLLQDVPAESFVERPLTSEEHKKNGVRKIVFPLKLTEHGDLYESLFSELLTAVVANPRAKDDDPVAPNEDKVKELSKQIRKLMEEFIDPRTEAQYVVVLNSAGQVVSSHVEFNYLFKYSKIDSDDSVPATTNALPDRVFQLKAVMNSTVADIGNAKIIKPPTEENSVDGEENLKGGLFSDIYNNETFSNDQIDR